MSQQRDTEELFYELVDLSPAERCARLDAVAGGAPEVGREVASLLRAYDVSEGFLSVSAPSTGVAVMRLGKYTVSRVLGRGSAGIVYLGYDPDLDRMVAIKALVSARLRGGGTDALRREARVLAGVVHPNVAQVYSIERVRAEDDSEHDILTMEFVPGTTLDRQLAAGALPIERCVDIGRQIAAALEAAHERSVVHRDLKPHNVHVTPDGWVKVLDFGLARLVESAGEGPSFGGTPGYMSPEQCRGEAVDHRSDLWSFGAVLYECITGEPLVAGASVAELLEANLEVTADLPASVPAPLTDLLRAALEPRRSQRLDSATSARRLLEEELLRHRAASLVARHGSLSPEDDDVPVPRGNLPRPLSTFIGRGTVLVELADHVSTHAIVTLTGPGGAGKTRTAVEAAARVEPSYPGGLWFVDLSNVTREDDVAPTVLRALGIRDPAAARGVGDVHGAVAASFGEERALVVLDNCEHVRDGAAALVVGLAARPRAPAMLVTSRQPLDVEGEQIVPLPPLDVPAESDDGRATRSEAEELFVSRARSRVPDFTPAGDHLETVREICRRVDGLPLAIELAASYVRALPLDEILRRVTDPSLGGTRRAEHARHGSLHALVDWSYRLLPPEEQALLRRLSTFRGGWTLALAESVCGGWGTIESWEVCDLLARLVERSLVEPVRSDGTRAARYRLLETIRTFAARELDGTGAEERATLERRHLDAIVESAAPRAGERGPTRSEWVDRIEPDYANVIRGLEIAVDIGRIDLAYELAEITSYYWVHRGNLRDGRRWMERLLARRAAPATTHELSGRADPTPEQLVRVLSRAGLIAHRLWDREGARALVDEACTLADELGDPLSLGHAHETRGLVEWMYDRLDEAEAAFHESRRRFEQAGEPGAAAVPLGNLGVVASGRGDYTAALGYFDEYIAVSRRIGSRHSEGRALINIGSLWTMLGSFDRAKAALEEAIAIHEACGDVPAAAMAHQNLGEALLALGDVARARASLARSYALRRPIGDLIGRASCIMFLARAAQQEGRRETAAVALGGLLARIDAGTLLCGPTARRRIEAWRDELRARMDAAALAEAEHRGAALSLGEIYALLEGE